MSQRNLTCCAAALALTWLVPAGFATSAQAAGGREDCAYASDASDQVVTYHDCATLLAGGGISLGPKRLEHLRYDDDGLAVVQVGALFFYVRDNGRSAPVAGVEGHAVEFHEDLAPSPRRVGHGFKVGYIDKNLDLVIPARWDGGLDFSDGRAQVCRGCHVVRDGDFAELRGGLWGCIDTRGREVVPVTQPSPDGLDCGSP